MKPLLRITLKVRDPMDPTKTLDIGGTEVNTLGNVTIILTRDQMGSVLIEESEVSEAPAWLEQVKEAELTFKELHESMAKTMLAMTYANTDLFALHKLLGR